MIPSFTIFSRQDYFKQLAKDIAATKPGDTVRLMTMAFKPHKPEIRPIMAALNKAARRGVKVHLIVDAMPFLLSDGIAPGPLLFSQRFPKTLKPLFASRLEALETLRHHGGHYTIINKPTKFPHNPLARRSHIKVALINDIVYTGGCNLSNVNHIDLMVRWHDPKTVAILMNFTDTVIATQNVREAMHDTDTSFAINSHTQLLIDSGVPNQSLILKEALALIDSAREFITISCQYFPNTIVAKKLQAAHKRGVTVRIIFNSPNQHRLLNKLIVKSTLRLEKLRLSAPLFADMLPADHRYIHAKLLATDKGAIVGSHNFVPLGVQFGTAEIALASTDDEFTKQAITALFLQIKGAPGFGNFT